MFNNYVDIDINVFFNLNSSSSRLRRHKFYIQPKKLSKYEVRRNFFSNRVINIWNSLPETIVCSETLNIFKGKIKNYKL